MLLIIEDKNNPTEPLAEETDGGSELVYIPTIFVPVKKDKKTLQAECELDRILYDFRQNKENQSSSPGQCGKLIPLFLKAVSRTGLPPEYITPSENFCPPQEEGRKLCARG
ncbi:MAG: hypothetical protein ACFWUD_04780 [Thermocaproicibacter melissae]|uniref:hypothetical protein n=1 Tax=Thermocaproicibacter melissae TaxID=2966552 RepID=UPI0024B0755D|nr:hypothetical protein [Thermocaproicibacter melissae]WBY64309.1 hypothetical protein NOG13_00920 [Thermocaproicibacter melissae]